MVAGSGERQRAVTLALESWLRGRGGDRLGPVNAWALAVPGKLLRPLLVLEAAGAVGGCAADVLPAAVGMELAHVASLLHDDIVDRDDVRRGRAAVHREFGTALAILGGDGLVFAAFEQIERCREQGVDGDAVRRAMGLLATAGRDLAEGVARELAFDFATWAWGGAEARVQAAVPDGPAEAAVVSEYVGIARLKTAALLRASCEMGAVLGGGSAAEAAALAAYGQALGVAFQIRDDLLPYSSTEAREGKPVDSDLRNARPSLPLLLVGALGGAGARAELAAIAAGGSRDGLTELLERTGALKQARVVAQDYAMLCHGALNALRPGAHRDVLRDLVAVAVGTMDVGTTAAETMTAATVPAATKAARVPRPARSPLAEDSKLETSK